MSTPTSTMVSLFGLDPEHHEPHPLHRAGRDYPETNCYADVLVELLHARGDEPLAALGCTLRTDWEGDQFTFFKPSPGDLERLFGLDVHEMQPHRGVAVQAAEQLAEGRTLLVELDSFHLPDTAATDYRRRHVKTSVAVEAIDLERRRLRYFHNAGYYELEGEDFDAVLRTAGPAGPDVLPPYTELVRWEPERGLEGRELRAAALELTRAHSAHRPASNPFERFGARLEADLPALLAGDSQGFHDYAFATVRMAGAAFEIAASHVEWLLGADGAAAAAAFGRVVEGCKVLSFRLARRRAFEPAERVAAVAAAWAEGMDALDRALG